MFTSNNDTGLAALPFIKDDPEGTPPAHLGGRSQRRFWAVETTGEVTADCNLGEAYAGAAADHMLAQGASPLLGWIAFAMAESRTYESDAKMIAVGFMGEIARLAMFGRRCLKAMEEVKQGGKLVLEHQEPDGSDDDDFVAECAAAGIHKPAALPSLEIRNPVGAGYRKREAGTR